MNSKTIGKLISIGNNGIIGEVSENLGQYITTLDGVRFIGEIGSYLTIDDIGRTIITEVIGVDEKISQTNNDMIKPNSSKRIFLNLLGEIVNEKFIFGVTRMPLIFSELQVISGKDLQLMHEVGNEEQSIEGTTDKTKSLLLPVGDSVIFPDYSVKINIDKFFGFHFAIFGNTGAGKSNTVARVIQNIFKKQNYSAKGAKFVIIDSNGEYNQALSDLNNSNPDITYKELVSTEQSLSNNKTNLEIPVWALTADDWAILLQASEKTQIPVIRRAIEIATIFYSTNVDDKIVDQLKNHILASTIIGIMNSSDSSPSKSDKIKSIITTFETDEINIRNNLIFNAIKIHFGQMIDPEGCIACLLEYENSDLLANFNHSKSINVVYDLSDFIKAVDFATLYEGKTSSQRIQEYTATLSIRLQSIKDSSFGKILKKTKFNSIKEYVANLLGNNQIVNIDISNLDDSSSEVITKVLAKLIFDFLKLKNTKAEMPINFIIEEAHRFVKNESIYNTLDTNIFERIAKEGRKYGMLLGISSQRPSELSKTVISQCSNFIIHRVQNPDDLQYISRMVPYINKGIIDRLTYLQTGTALIFGTAINLPTLTKFSQANPTTDSDNARISEKWYIE